MAFAQIHASRISYDVLDSNRVGSAVSCVGKVNADESTLAISNAQQLLKVMCEVYRARDTRLGRDVAVKVLPSSFAADADPLHRFEQEA